MIINKTHSKKNLIDLFAEIGYCICNRNNKRGVIIEIKALLNHKLNIKKDNNHNIQDLTELLDYLKKPNNNEKISLEEKNKVMFKCKKIIKYAKEGYNFGATEYKSRQELYNDIIYISPYGFIPSVRRACKLYNNDVNRIDHVNPIIPKKIQNELNEKRLIKKQHYFNFKVTKGNFRLTFD